MENLAPTLERLKRSEWDAPEVNQQTERRAWRVRTLVESMHNHGTIDSEQLAAWKFYAWDVEQSNRYASGVGSYGERRGGGVGELDPLDYKILSSKRASAAEAALSNESVRLVIRSLARDDMSLTELAAKFSMERRRMSQLLRQGITDLHRHYSGPPQRR